MIRLSTIRSRRAALARLCAREAREAVSVERAARWAELIDRAEARRQEVPEPEPTETRTYPLALDCSCPTGTALWGDPICAQCRQDRRGRWVA